MKRESINMTWEAEQEFERRMEEFFSEIFPQHAQCSGSCRGHQLPDMAKRFLKELGYPADLKSLTIAARSWFERIDLDASGSIDRYKVCMLTGACTHTHTHTHTSGGKGSIDIAECMCVNTHTRTSHAYACAYGQGGTYKGIGQDRHHSIYRILAVEISRRRWQRHVGCDGVPRYGSSHPRKCARNVLGS